MDILTKINWIDVIVAIITIRITCVAFREGLSHEIFPLIGAVVCLTMALHYYTGIASLLFGDSLNIPSEILEPVSFIAIIVFVGIIFKFVKAILDKLIKVTWHPGIERLGGVAIGAVRALLVSSITLIIFSLVPLPYLQWSIRDRSVTGMYVLEIGSTLYTKIAPMLPTISMGEASDSRDELVKRLSQDKLLKIKPGEGSRAIEDRTKNMQKSLE